MLEKTCEMETTFLTFPNMPNVKVVLDSWLAKVAAFLWTLFPHPLCNWHMSVWDEGFDNHSSAKKESYCFWDPVNSITELLPAWLAYERRKCWGTEHVWNFLAKGSSSYSQTEICNKVWEAWIALVFPWHLSQFLLNFCLIKLQQKLCYCSEKYWPVLISCI